MKHLLLTTIAAVLLVNEPTADEFEFNTEFFEPNYRGIGSFDFIDENLLIYSNWREVGTVDLRTKNYLWKKENRNNTPSKLIRTKNNYYIYTYKLPHKECEVINCLNPLDGNIVWSNIIEHSYGTNNYVVASLSLGKNIISSISPDVPTTEVKEESILVNLDSSTGKEIWIKTISSTALDAPVDGFNNCVYLPLNAGGVECIEVNNGETLWKNLDAGEVKGSPAIYKDRVFFSDFNGFVFAANKATGKVEWKSHVGGPCITKPLASNLNKLFVTSLDGNIYCLNMQNGEIEWKSYGGWYLVSSPILVGKTIFFTSTDTNLYGISAVTGKQIVKGTGNYPIGNVMLASLLFNPPYFYGDKVFFSDSYFLHSCANKTNPLGFTNKLEIKVKNPFTFDFLSVDGTIYDVEKSVDLKAWQKTKSLKGDGNKIIITEDNPNQSGAFFRIRNAEE